MKDRVKNSSTLQETEEITTKYNVESDGTLEQKKSIGRKTSDISVSHFVNGIVPMLIFWF